MSAVPRYDGSGLHHRSVDPWAMFAATLVIGLIVMASVVLVAPQRSALWACISTGGVDPSQVLLVEDVETTPLGADRQLVVARIEARGPQMGTMRCTVRVTEDGPMVERVDGLRG